MGLLSPIEGLGKLKVVSTDDLDSLERKWKDSGSFEDEQAYLRGKVASGGVRYVTLNPDGSWNPWIAVVVKARVGVVYETQCAGTGCDQRLVEGFLVPLGGLRVVPDHGQINTDLLTEVFHEGKACVYSWCGDRLPADRLERLERLIEDIPYWPVLHKPTPLKFDSSRIKELAEGWIPVVTPEGAGVLVFDNCD
jgi:hypothetical protein